MSDNAKKIWLVIATLFVVGLGLSIIGIICGGGNNIRQVLLEEEQGGKGISKYVHFSADSLWIGPNEESETKEEIAVKNVEGTKVTEGDMVIFTPFTSADSLTLEIGAGEFFIKESENGNLYYEASQNLKMESKMSGDTLVLRAKPKRKNTLFKIGNSQTGKLIVYLPQKQLKKLDVEMGAGELSIENDINAEKIELEVGAGEVKGESVKTEKFKANIGAGQFAIKKLIATETDIEVAMGACQIDSVDAKKIKIEVAMGEATVGVTAKQTETTYEAECGLGQLCIGDQKIEGSGKNSEKSSGEEKLKIDAECGMGQLTIDFEK